jgi:LuxR family maltose regulon positive regulatory protein
MPRNTAPSPARLAKLTRPRLTDVLLRERLFRRLDDRRCPIVWIHGPPGAGKTTLASSYIAERSLRHLWYQLDAGDGDLATFFHYLGVAVAGAAPRPRKPLPHLTAEYLAGLPVFARRFFEALGERLEPPFALVLDNYQEVPADSAFHAVLREGLAALPQGVVTLVLSRASAPPELARARANHELALLGWNELQLTLEEVKAIEHLRRPGRRSDSYRELYSKTCGWAAGLVLLLEQEGSAPCARPPARDNPQVLFDYFAGEIFARLDQRTQDVLLASALLPTMKQTMVEELIGTPGAGSVLADLHRRNYFITLKRPPPDPVYEYHPLFRDFLLTRGKAEFSASRVEALQKKAAALYEADGQPENAAELLHAARDVEALARLVVTHARALTEQGRGQVLEGWLSDLPADAYEREPWLDYWRGMCRLPFDPLRARTHFERAYRRFKARRELTGSCLAWCALVDSVAFGWGDFKPLERWLAEMEDVLAVEPRLASAELEAQVACGMFLALMYARPQHPDMARWEQRARQIILEGGNRRLQERVGNHLLVYYTWWIGDLAKAELLVTTLGAQIQRPGVAPLTQIIWHTMAAGYYWMSAANAKCIACVDRGLEIGDASGVHAWDMLLCSQGVFASLSSDDTDLAARYLRRMETRLSTSPPMEAGMSMYEYLSAWHRATQGDLAAAREFAHTAVAMAEKAGAQFPAAAMRNDLGRLLVYLGDTEEGLALIRQARSEGRTMKTQTLEYLTLLSEAEIAMTRGEEQACLECLRRALAVGGAQQFQNHTWWCSQTMSRLYAKALAHGIEEKYVAGVIRKRRLAPPEEALPLENWPWLLRVHTLGRFAVLKDGGPMDFARKASRKPLELLKALIAFGGAEVGQGALIDALWPESEGDRAQQSFEMALHRLRKLFGADAMLALKGQRLTLDARYVWVDSWALERALQRLQAALGCDAEPAALDTLERQLCSLYPGHFLPGETAAWAVERRERLRNRFLLSLEKLGTHHEARCDGPRALRCYQHGVDIEPLSETLCYRLMCCHRALGQPAEALAVYRRCRTALTSLLGTAPAREIEALALALGASPGTPAS